MKANDLFLLKVFSTHTVFEIPYYQRAYVWEEDNWKRFLEDMETISAVEKPYFIGSLILKQKETETGSKYGDVRVVIDGQQRLTTITVFFKVLSLKRNRPQIFNDFLITISDESDEKEISIHHNHIDKEAFNKIVNLTELVDLSVDEKGKKIESPNRIIQLYNYLYKNLDVEKISSDKVKKYLHFVVIDLGDVLCLQLVAEVVDLMLNVEGAVHIVRFFTAAHQFVHLGERVVRETHHLVNMAILLVVEVILLAVVFAGDGAGHVVAGIADGLQFAHLTQHSADLTLRVIREVGITDVFKVFGNLQFHIVADALVFLDAGVELVEFALLRVFLVGGAAGEVEQILHHPEHALHTL